MVSRIISWKFPFRRENKNQFSSELIWTQAASRLTRVSSFFLKWARWLIAEDRSHLNFHPQLESLEPRHALSFLCFSHGEIDWHVDDAAHVDLVVKGENSLKLTRSWHENLRCLRNFHRESLKFCDSLSLFEEFGNPSSHETCWLSAENCFFISCDRSFIERFANKSSIADLLSARQRFGNLPSRSLMLARMGNLSYDSNAWRRPNINFRLGWAECPV